MRKNAVLPSNMKAGIPGAYRIWSACKRHNELWWPGGISNQPHILMDEFMVCEVATKMFDEQKSNYIKIIQGG